MDLQILIIVGIIIVLGILAITLVSVNRAYAFKHTIDEKPKDLSNTNQPE